MLARLNDGVDATPLVGPLLAAFGEEGLAEQFRKHLSGVGPLPADVLASGEELAGQRFFSAPSAQIASAVRTTSRRATPT